MSVVSNQKQPRCKSGIAKMDIVKICEIQGGTKKWLGLYL